MPAYTYVDEPAEMIARLDGLARIGIDTEFMRERTYFSQLCLVQIGAPNHIYCVDPMTDVDLSAFWDMLCARTSVLHSGRQDIEVLFHTAGRMPQRVLDTQVAAALSGFQPQIGYANLVRELFDVELPKTHTRANWAQRPLPEKLLDYAAEDVEYLLPAWDALAERLDRKGRVAWAEADSAELLDPALYDIDPARAIARVKGARNLRGRRRAAAAGLAHWREAEALKRDRPRQWILKDTVLIEIANRLPQDHKELSRIDALPAKLVARAGDEMLAAIAAASSDGDDYRPPSSPDEAQKSLLKKMQSVVADRAAELDIAAETIASRKELAALIIDGERRSRLLDGWRRELIGDELAQLI